MSTLFSAGASATLGLGYATNAQEVAVPRRVPNTRRVAKLAVSDIHVVCLHWDGTVSTWGSNTAHGLLGLGDVYSRCEPCAIPELSDVVDLTASNEFTVAVLHPTAATIDSQTPVNLLAWGRPPHASPTPSPKRYAPPCLRALPKSSRVRLVAASPRRGITFFVTSDNRVFASGVEIEAFQAPSSIEGIVADETFAAAVLANGSVWIWNYSSIIVASPTSSMSETGITPIDHHSKRIVGSSSSSSPKFPDGTPQPTKQQQHPVRHAPAPQPLCYAKQLRFGQGLFARIERLSACDGTLGMLARDGRVLACRPAAFPRVRLAPRVILRGVRDFCVTGRGGREALALDGEGSLYRIKGFLGEEGSSLEPRSIESVGGTLTSCERIWCDRKGDLVFASLGVREVATTRWGRREDDENDEEELELEMDDEEEEGERMMNVANRSDYFPSLFDLVAEALVGELSIFNVAEALAEAENFSHPDLHQSCLEFLARNRRAYVSMCGGGGDAEREALASLLRGFEEENDDDDNDVISTNGGQLRWSSNEEEEEEAGEVEELQPPLSLQRNVSDPRPIRQKASSHSSMEHSRGHSEMDEEKRESAIATSTTPISNSLVVVVGEENGLSRQAPQQSLVSTQSSSSNRRPKKRGERVVLSGTSPICASTISPSSSSSSSATKTHNSPPYSLPAKRDNTPKPNLRDVIANEEAERGRRSAEPPSSPLTSRSLWGLKSPGRANTYAREFEGEISRALDTVVPGLASLRQTPPAASSTPRFQDIVTQQKSEEERKRRSMKPLAKSAWGLTSC